MHFGANAKNRYGYTSEELFYVLQAGPDDQDPPLSGR
jgi:hypothetical protein